MYACYKINMFKPNNLFYVYTEMVKDIELLLGLKNILFFAYCEISTIIPGLTYL